jgi:multicomponent Na+:H+ antiporter subunit B
MIFPILSDALFWGLLFTSTVILFSANFLLVIPLMGVFSLLMVSLYLLHAATDVAITEAAVGACMSSVLLLMAYFYAKPQNHNRPGYKFWWGLLFTIIFLSSAVLIKSLPIIGDEKNVIHHHVANFYMANASKDFDINSIVTSVLAGYRAYDTLGETIVILIAALGVIRVLKKS